MDEAVDLWNVELSVDPGFDEGILVAMKLGKGIIHGVEGRFGVGGELREHDEVK